MANFYILLEDRLLKISGDITVDNITQALGYIPSNFSGDFNDLTNNPFAVDDSGEFNIVDELGNIVAKINSLGLQTVDVIAGEHVLSNKVDLELLEDYVVKEELTFESILDNPLAEDESGNLTIIDSENNIGLLLNEDGLRAKEVFAGDHVLSNKAENSVVEEISNKVNTLIGDDSDKSVRTIANEELLGLLLEGNDNFQTLQELAAWIDEHPEDASAMNELIQQNKSDITALTDAYKMADTENLAEAKEYTDLINFHSLKENPFVVDETGELNIIDESGNIGFKLGTEGVSAKDFLAGNHILSSKADKSYTDDKVTLINTNINNKVTLINTTIDTKVSEINTNIDTLVQLINETINDSVEELNNAINELSQNSNSSDAQVLRESKEYTDSAVSNISFLDINNNPVTVDEIGEFNIVDELGNIGLKVSSEGVFVKDIVAGEHILSSKQDTLTSGTNIKTINGESILGSGDIVINSSSSEETTIDNGVYAVTADGKLIDYNIADSTATGVALVAGEHKFMIAKSDATDGSNSTLYWTKSYSDLSLTNYTKSDGTNLDGYLPKPDGTFGGSTHLSDDFTTWTNGALSDFNGKANTAVIAAASSHAKDMCTVLNTFNASDSFKDWYVPACGQLALMYLNMTEINAALAKIGGTALAAEYYWSSSEYSSGYAWFVGFNTGYVDSYGKGYYGILVRFVRDISTSKPLKERVSDLESSKQNTLISGTNIKTINGESILGSGDIVISGGGSSSGGSSAYAEVNHGTGDTTFILTPNTFHVWDEVASLDLSFADGQDGVANEYLFQFTSGATATTLTLPDGLKWANDSAPTIAKNMIYQVSVLKGLASVLEFSNGSTLIENYGTYNTGSMASGATLTFEYPVASDLTISLKYAYPETIVLAKGQSSITIDWIEPSAPEILGITPNEDDTYIYII